MLQATYSWRGNDGGKGIWFNLWFYVHTVCMLIKVTIWEVWKGRYSGTWYNKVPLDRENALVITGLLIKQNHIIIIKFVGYRGLANNYFAFWARVYQDTCALCHIKAAQLVKCVHWNIILNMNFSFSGLGHMGRFLVRPARSIWLCGSSQATSFREAARDNQCKYFHINFQVHNYTHSVRAKMLESLNMYFHNFIYP